MFSTADLSADTRALVDCLLAAPVGGVVTFRDMSAALGSDVKRRPHLMPRAVAIASREVGALFSSVRGVGYKRLSATEAHKIGESARARIRRTAGTAAKRIGRAIERANDMPDDARRHALSEIGALEVLRHISSGRGAVAAVPRPEKAAPIAETMRAMMDRLGAA